MAPIRETLPSPRALVLTRGGESIAESFGANAVALLGRSGVLLVDPLIAPSEARLVEEAVRRRTSAPVVGVVLTHHHTDHALGAGHFARRGVPVWASRPCAELMARFHPELVAARRADPVLAPLFADAEPYSPARLVDDVVAFDLGGLTALVRIAGPAHTPGDLIVEVPEESLLVAGDLISHGYHVNYEEAEVAGYESALERLARRAFALVVPGHGAPGGQELLAEALAEHRESREVVRVARAAGVPPAEVASRLEARHPEWLLRGALAETAARL